MDFFQSLLQDAMRALELCYHKILRIDLTTDRYEPIRISTAEWPLHENHTYRYSAWSQDFIFNTVHIHPDDRTELATFMRLENLRERAALQNATHFRYRRRFDNSQEYRWCTVLILRSVEYTPTNRQIMIFVRDAHEEYLNERERTLELEHAAYFDAVSGLRNRWASTVAIDRISQCEESAGVLFADLNGLKFENDTRGHNAGNALIQQFAKMLTSHFRAESVFRIGGDEFLCLLENIPEDAFNMRMRRFHAALAEKSCPPIAAIGWCWVAQGKKAYEALSEAEIRMYEDKERCRVKNPDIFR